MGITIPTPKLSPHQLFNQLFSRSRIKQTYEQKVASRGGKGIDGLTPERFHKNANEHFRIIHKKCRNGSYKFAPYVELLQSKGRGKLPRVISRPTLRDKIVLDLLKELLHQVFHECVNRKLPNQYVREFLAALEPIDKNNFCFLKVDVQEFYDSIHYETLFRLLKARIRSKKILTLIKRAVTNSTVPPQYKSSLGLKAKNDKGVPQGLAISNILANIYLYAFDELIGDKCTKYLRYVDDIFVIVSKGKEEDVETLVVNELSTRHLRINPDKTGKGDLTKSFDYLGYRIVYPLVSVRQSTVDKFIGSIAAKFTSYRYNSARKVGNTPWFTKDVAKVAFVEELNEKITGAISENRRYGWIFYFLEINDNALLFKLDKIISSFFERLDDFDNKPPAGLKRLVRAHYEARYHPTAGYIHDYNAYVTIQQKIDYLNRLGLLDPAGRYGEKEIISLFEATRRRHLGHLELDVGTMS